MNYQDCITLPVMLSWTFFYDKARLFCPALQPTTTPLILGKPAPEHAPAYFIPAPTKPRLLTRQSTRSTWCCKWSILFQTMIFHLDEIIEQCFSLNKICCTLFRKNLCFILGEAVKEKIVAKQFSTLDRRYPRVSQIVFTILDILFYWQNACIVHKRIFLLPQNTLSIFYNKGFLQLNKINLNWPPQQTRGKEKQ